MSRPLGGYIGYDAEPTTAAAPGIWTLREAELYQRKVQWPVPSVPPKFSGLQIWLDAADTATLYDSTTGGSLVAADGGVARWEDKSGNDNHATQGTGGSQPLRKESVINGLDVMRFDGTDDFLAADGLTSAISDLSGSLTFFAVVSRDSTGRTDQIFTLFGPAEGSDVNSDGLQFYYSNAELLTAQSRQYDGGFTDKLCQSDATTAAPALLTFRGLSSSSWRVNGTDITASGTTTDLTFASGVSLSLATVGARRRGDTPDVAQYFDGDVCELIIYNTALSDTDRDEVESYLTAKWAIT